MWWKLKGLSGGSSKRRIQKTTYQPMLEALEDRLALDGVTSHWTNGLGAANPNWSQPGNWDNNKVPGSGDTAIFDANPAFPNSNNPCTYDIVAAGGGPGWLHNMTITTAYTSSITLNGAGILLDGVYSQAAGTITGPGNLDIGESTGGTVKGSLNWTGGTMTGTGTTNISDDNTNDAQIVATI